MGREAQKRPSKRDFSVKKKIIIKNIYTSPRLACALATEEVSTSSVLTLLLSLLLSGNTLVPLGASAERPLIESLGTRRAKISNIFFFFLKGKQNAKLMCAVYLFFLFHFFFCLPQSDHQAFSFFLEIFFFKILHFRSERKVCMRV